MRVSRARFLSLAGSALAAAAVAPSVLSKTAFAAPALVTLPAPEKANLTLAHSTYEPTQLAYAVAKEAGFFTKYGLNVDLVFAEGDAKTVQALVSSGSDFGAMGVGPVVSSLTTDLPLISLTMTATRLTDSIVVGPDIKSAADLKGKSVAISAIGGTSHGAALIGLQNAGLTGDDVILSAVGGQSARIAALRAGSVHGAVVDSVLDDEMKAQGLNILSHTADSALEYGRNGMNTRREFFEANPNTCLAMTAALLEGQNLIFSDPAKATEIFMAWARLDNADSASRQVTAFTTYGARTLRSTPGAWELTRTVLSSVQPELLDVDVSKAYTTVPLDKLQELGLNAELGI
ncbi:MAG: ABC transporter substrate-binding protein [Chloroflexi bacterium]|nr:ABC transporter substrate-binding protein [Chloroflexota bacterium]